MLDSSPVRIRDLPPGSGNLLRMKGPTIGALNGLYIDRIDLEDFLHFNLVNQCFTGLSTGIVNYSARLKGVQIGLVNYAGTIRAGFG